MALWQTFQLRQVHTYFIGIYSGHSCVVVAGVFILASLFVYTYSPITPDQANKTKTKTNITSHSQIALSLRP